MKISYAPVESKEASEVARKIHENSEATVFSTNAEQIKGIINSQLLLLMMKARSATRRIEEAVLIERA